MSEGTIKEPDTLDFINDEDVLARLVSCVVSAERTKDPLAAKNARWRFDIYRAEILRRMAKQEPSK